MSNNNDYHMTPLKEGEFNPTIIIIFAVIVVIIIIGAYIYFKYYRW